MARFNKSQMEHRRSDPPYGHGCSYKSVGRAQSTLSVSAVDHMLTLPVTCPPSPAFSTVTLTPGRVRNIDQDMEALRISRQDNPFIQQVIASRESLVESLAESESDDINLMAQEFSDFDVDPMTLPEMHEHMIRSPPPVSWPRSPNFKVFQFPIDDDDVSQTKDKSPRALTPHDPQPAHGESSTSPFRARSHLDRFSLLTPAPMRSLAEARLGHVAEDSVQLMSGDD